MRERRSRFSCSASRKSGSSRCRNPRIALLAVEEAVEAVERELSRHGRLPARTRSGELAGLLLVGPVFECIGQHGQSSWPLLSMSANRAMMARFIVENGSSGSSCSAAQQSSLAIALSRRTGRF